MLYKLTFLAVVGILLLVEVATSQTLEAVSDQSQTSSIVESSVDSEGTSDQSSSSEDASSSPSEGGCDH